MSNVTKFGNYSFIDFNFSLGFPDDIIGRINEGTVDDIEDERLNTALSHHIVS